LDEPNWGIKHGYVEKSQWNPLYTHHILIKMFLKKKVLKNSINTTYLASTNWAQSPVLLKKKKTIQPKASIHKSYASNPKGL
jgi:hypothetical protein